MDSEERDFSGNKRSDYVRWGVEPPSHVEHEFDASKLVAMEATRWWMEGNMLMAQTNHGVLAQPIPTNYICAGMDGDGLPILRKLDIT